MNFGQHRVADATQSVDHEGVVESLEDFCRILTWGWTSFPIHITKDLERQRFSWRREDSFSQVFPPAPCVPLQLRTALTQDALSLKHKVFLAYTIAKAFWQYYESKWMRKTWSLDTIQLLQTESVDSEAPFLKINREESASAVFNEHEPGHGLDGIPYAHRYPYIFNLGLLLVQIGSLTSTKQDIVAKVAINTVTKEYNDLCVACCRSLIDKSWPPIESVAQANVQSEYRRIAGECFPILLPKDLFKTGVEAKERKSALKNRVVRPLYKLYQDMARTEEWRLRSCADTQAQATSVLQTGTAAVENERSGTNLNTMY